MAQHKNRIKNRFSKRLTLKKIEQQKINLVKILVDRMYGNRYTYKDVEELFKFSKEINRRIGRIVNYD